MFSIAAEKGLHSLVERLLKGGVEFDVQNHDRTPLSYAVAIGRKAIVRLLLDWGA
ncbi:hypothetical protein V8C34DRAFT_293435 [Trichoderma compactum]